MRFRTSKKPGASSFLMRLAAIYDIHGNLPALEAVLDEIRRAEVDRLVVGGDVLPGPMPRECLDCLLEVEIPVQFIMGNGDREVLARMAGIETDWYRTAPAQWREPVRWTAQQLLPEYRSKLAAWPRVVSVNIPGPGKTLFCHATPSSDTEIFTRLTSEERLGKLFAEADAQCVICGHTHMQFDRLVGNIRIVNAGSVRMPFGEPGADWLLFTPEAELRHTAYDLGTAAERIRSTDYPQAEEFASRYVLQPPSEAETLKAFSKAEG